MPEPEEESVVPAVILKAVAGHLNISNYGANTQLNRAVEDFYPLARKVMLENHYWSFAETQSKLTASEEDGEIVKPEFGFSNFFDLPVDFVSLTYINNSGEFRVNNLKWQILGTRIAVNGDKAYLSYTRNEEDHLKFSPVFEYTLGLFIAQNLCYNITRNTDREIFLLRSFNRQKMESIEISHRQTGIENFENSSYTDARTGGADFSDLDSNFQVTPTPLYPGG